MEKRISIDPNYADDHPNLGIALHEQDDAAGAVAAGAVAALKNAVAIDSDDSKARLHLNETLREQGGIRGFLFCSNEVDYSALCGFVSFDSVVPCVFLFLSTLHDPFG